MSRISEEDIGRVRDATDLISLMSERIVLKQKGRLFWGLCPFHGEKTPSLKVDPATQLWHCFGCGLGGDAFGFTMRVENVDFPDAVRILAERARIEITEVEGGAPRGLKERTIAACEEAASFYHKTLTTSRDKQAEEARAYLGDRGFGSDIARTWRLGWAPGRGALVRHLTAAGFSREEIVAANLAFGDERGGGLRDRFYERIMFPITDLHGRTIAFGGRILGKGEPKYLNSSDTPAFRKSSNMYGIDRAKGPITASGTAVVVEGYTDVIALHRAGVTTAVATLGTALTRQHIKLLGRFAKKVVYLFDGDEAGMRAADRAAEFIDADITPEAGARLDLLVAVIPEGKDPADYVAANGADAMNAVVDRAVPLLRFAIERRLARWDLDRPEERSRALKDAAEVLAPVKDSLLADDYANLIADRLMADFATVRRAISQTRVTPSHPELAEDAPGADAGPSAFPQAVTTEARAEIQLLGLMVSVPGLRGGARRLLADDLLSVVEHRRLAEVIAEEASASSAALISRLDREMPGAGDAVTAVTFAEGSDEIEATTRELERRLKEFALERRIAAGKARLKRPDSFKDAAEYDELYREVSALQRELEMLRSEAI